MSTNSRAVVSVVATMIMVVMTVLVAAWSTARPSPAPVEPPAPAAITNHLPD